MPNMIEDLGSERWLTLLAAGVSHTDYSAKRALSEFGFPDTALQPLRDLGFVVDSPGAAEWRLNSGLRRSLILAARERHGQLWIDSHAHYLSNARLDGDGADHPVYLSTGPGYAYHGTEIEPSLADDRYGTVSLIESASVNIQALTLASEQARRDLLDFDSPALTFLRGITHYRNGNKNLGLQLLRATAARSDKSKEVAIAQHLVGYSDCMSGDKKLLKGARHLLKKSQINARSRGDDQHMAHVKHSMALCILKTDPKRAHSAVTLLEQSLALTEGTDLWGEAKVRHTLGQALAKSSGSRKAAQSQLQKSLEIGRNLGYERHCEEVERSLTRLGFTTARGSNK